MKATFKHWIIAIVMVVTMPFALSDSKDTPVDSLAASVTEAANADNISNDDLAIRYSIYQGAYLYGTKFNFDDSTNFGVVFDKMTKIRNKLVPSKTEKTKEVINGILKKYEEMPFDDNSKSKFLEECNSIAKGIKDAID
jgi:hypothetical protein